MTVLLLLLLGAYTMCGVVGAGEGDADVTSYHGVDDPELLKWLHIPVQEVWHASKELPGFEDVNSDEDQAEINQWNDADMAPWEARRDTLTMDALWAAPTARRRVNFLDVKRLVAIRNNSVYFLHQDVPPFNASVVSFTPAQPANAELEIWANNLRAALKRVPFPDVVFMFSVFDWPMCNPAHNFSRCTVPLFSYQKRAGWHDILIPRLNEMVHPLYFFDWRHKVNKAFMRATPFCQGGTTQPFVKCARSYFAQLTQYHNKGHILEAGLVGGFDDGSREGVLSDGPLAARGMFPLRDHARYKYLLDTDGMTGSYRASKLMHFNSPIFKQNSPFLEWYTRSLKPGVHHIKFWVHGKDDIFDVLESSRHNESALQEMAHTAMRFAYKYTSPHARVLYMRRALTKYKALFGPSMDAWMAKFDWSAATA